MTRDPSQTASNVTPIKSVATRNWNQRRFGLRRAAIFIGERGMGFSRAVSREGVAYAAPIEAKDVGQPLDYTIAEGVPEGPLPQCYVVGPRHYVSR